MNWAILRIWDGKKERGVNEFSYTKLLCVLFFFIGRLLVFYRSKGSFYAGWVACAIIRCFFVLESLFSYGMKQF